MTPTTKRIRWFAVRACVLLLVLAGSGAAVDAGGCTDSGDCAAPTPYCHALRAVCVECLADANCGGSTGRCKLDEGLCVPCTSHEHCMGMTPYCSREEDRCVECLTDANCQDRGVTCRGGRCGWCGDGVCDPSEQYLFVGTCFEDCFVECPEADLGSRTGVGVASGSTEGRASRGYGACGGADGPEATFEWVAPHDGTYEIKSGSDTVVAVLIGGCAGALSACGSDASPLRIQLEQGQKVALIIDSERRGGTDYSLDIEDRAEACVPSACPDVGPGMPCCTADETCGVVGLNGCEAVSEQPMDSGGGGAPSGPGECLERARARGEPLCEESTACACNRCPFNYDRCAETAGCRDIVRCMDRHRCVEEGCHTKDRCAHAIDSSGGLEGAAYRWAAALAACGRASLCALECGEDAGSSAPTDAGRDSSTEAGRTDRMDAAPVDAGAATDGGGGGSRTSDGGCGCIVGVRRAPAAALSFVVLVASFAGALRRLSPRPRRSDRRR